MRGREQESTACSEDISVMEFICLLSHYIRDGDGLFFLFSEAKTQKRKKNPQVLSFCIYQSQKNGKNNITDVAWERILRCG